MERDSWEAAFVSAGISALSPLTGIQSKLTNEQKDLIERIVKDLQFMKWELEH